MTSVTSCRPDDLHGEPGRLRQALALALVTCAVATIYITQPVLPILEAQFAVSPSAASLTVSAVILGMASTTLPIGALVDRHPARRVMLAGGVVVALMSGLCAITESFRVLVALRFVQGASIPALTTCVAAWLSRTLPPQRLNVALGTYVAATVAGGLAGRLVAGWAFDPTHWRGAFVAAGAALAIFALLATYRLPEPPRTSPSAAPTAFSALLARPTPWLAGLAAFGAFGAFSTVFNYFPFRLSTPPWSLSTPAITALYLVYVAGLLMGPVAGRLANRVGNGSVMVAGTLVLAGALALTFVVSMTTLVASLVALCAGFFAIHAAAVGALNRAETHARGRANALYTLFYYAGGAVGIAAAGELFAHAGWPGVVAICLALAILPLAAGLAIAGRERQRGPAARR